MMAEVRTAAGGQASCLESGVEVRGTAAWISGGEDLQGGEAECTMVGQIGLSRKFSDIRRRPSP